MLLNASLWVYFHRHALMGFQFNNGLLSESVSLRLLHFMVSRCMMNEKQCYGTGQEAPGQERVSSVLSLLYDTLSWYEHEPVTKWLWPWVSSPNKADASELTEENKSKSSCFASLLNISTYKIMTCFFP